MRIRVETERQELTTSIQLLRHVCRRCAGIRVLFRRLTAWR